MTTSINASVQNATGEVFLPFLKKTVSEGSILQEKINNSGIFCFDAESEFCNTEDIRAKMLFLNRNKLATALAQTDWQVIRAADPTSGKPLTDDIFQKREQCRQRCNQIETKILAAASYEELLVIYQEHL